MVFRQYLSTCGYFYAHFYMYMPWYTFFLSILKPTYENGFSTK